jgi:carboxylate-amine ligase
MEVMTTYGPDINVSFPKEISDKLFGDVDDLNAKVNFYAPALAALSLASPFLNGKPWMYKGDQGKSYRTFKRSVVAPAIELHADEDFRIEFKVFEMTKNVSDFETYFLVVLALFLDESLKGRASNQERIYDLGSVARSGLQAEGIKYRLSEVYERALEVLPKFGFDPSPLHSLKNRIEKNSTPADEMLELYAKFQSINEVIREFSYIVTKTGERI